MSLYRLHLPGLPNHHQFLYCHFCCLHFLLFCPLSDLLCFLWTVSECLQPDWNLLLRWCCFPPVQKCDRSVAFLLQKMDWKYITPMPVPPQLPFPFRLLPFFETLFSSVSFSPLQCLPGPADPDLPAPESYQSLRSVPDFRYIQMFSVLFSVSLYSSLRTPTLLLRSVLIFFLLWKDLI